MNNSKKDFLKIKKYFSIHRTNLENFGDDGFFHHSNLEIMFEIFKSLKNYKNFLDLGSGDGRIVFLASIFFNSSGIEKNKKLYNLSLFHKKNLGINVNFENFDYYKKDLDKYDLIFINPDSNLNNLEKYFFNFNSHYLINVTLFKPRYLLKIKEFDFGLENYGLYEKNKDL